MVDATSSGCINHPGVEAVARCKQCGKPVCGMCVKKGPTGNFCSDGCRDQYATFIERAADFDARGRKSGWVRKLRTVFVKLILLVLGLAVLVFLGAQFDVPVLSAISDKVMGMLGR